MATFTPPDGVLYLSGEIDLGCLNLTVDASGVTYVDSGSLRILADGCRRFAAAGGSLAVVRPSSCFLRVARLAGFIDSGVQVFSATSDALSVDDAAAAPHPGRTA
jgi:anti-anti-sigma regulatory factor